MDILETIKEKIRSIPTSELSSGVRAVISHIETAERYFHRGKKENEENLFTDVIYRTNHAFEGILKEAYTILTGKNGSKKAPNHIEKYFSSNKLFNPRVLDLFTNYRTEWRNTSTHDYQVFFTEQEAFLAIVSVSAFINILLDQMIEHISFLKERAETEKRVDELKSKISTYESLSFLGKTVSLLAEFSREIQKSDRDLISVTESELIGMLSGFISSVEPNLKLETQALIKDGTKNLRPDIILEEESEKLVIELKRSSHKRLVDKAAEAQILSYLSATGISCGILYFFPTNKDAEIVIENYTHEFRESRFHITKIFPQNLV